MRGYADQAARVTVPGVTKVAIQHADEVRKPFVNNDGSISEGNC